MRVTEPTPDSRLRGVPNEKEGGGGEHEQGQERVTQDSTTQYLPADELRVFEQRSSSAGRS